MPEARRPTAFHSNHFKMSIYLSNLESQTINRDPDNNGVNIQVLNKTINFPFFILFFFSLMLILNSRRNSNDAIKSPAGLFMLKSPAFHSLCALTWWLQSGVH